MRFVIVFLSCFLIFSLGCEEPRIDGTSPESYQESLDEVRADLSETEDKDLHMKILVMSLHRVKHDPSVNTEEDVYMTYDGMTADDIFDRAEHAAEAEGMTWSDPDVFFERSGLEYNPVE